MTPPPPPPPPPPPGGGGGGGGKRSAPVSICDGARPQAARGRRWRRPPKAAGSCGPQARKCVAGAEGAGGASRAVGPRGPTVFLLAQVFEYYGSCRDRSRSLRDIWQDIGKPRDIWKPRDTGSHGTSGSHVTCPIGDKSIPIRAIFRPVS